MDTMFFQIIETSSAGNCAFMRYGSSNILIDAGVGIRKIESYLKTMDMTPADIDAIFITHEHIDHCRALKSFKKYRTHVFSNRLTGESIRCSEPDTKQLEWSIFEDGASFEFSGLTVSAFSTPHDSSDSVGYCFKGSQKCLVWMTDLGKVTFLAKDFAQCAQILVLESNYCPRMLENSSRPYSLKTRIKGSHGHLSNADAIGLLKTLDSKRLEKIYLAHISRECNSVELIRELLSDVGDVFSKIEIVSPFSEDGYSSAYKSTDETSFSLAD